MSFPGVSAAPVKPRADQITSGAPTGFSENFSAAYDEYLKVESPYGVAVDLMDRYNGYREEYESVTGEALPTLNDLGAGSRVAAKFAGIAYSQPELELEVRRNKYGVKTSQTATDVMAIIDRMDKAAEQYGTKRLQDIYDEVAAEAVASYRKLEAVRERSGGVSGGLGAFLGGLSADVAGMFGGRDPLGLVTLPVGGFGKTVVRRVATEGATQATVEGVQQFGRVKEQKEQLGLPASNREAAINTLTAGLAGAGLRGVGEGAVKGVQYWRSQSTAKIVEEIHKTQPTASLATTPKDVAASPTSVRATTMALEREAVQEAYNPASIKTEVAVMDDIRHDKAMDAAELSMLGYPDAWDNVPLPSAREIRDYTLRTAEVQPEHEAMARSIREAIAMAVDTSDPAALKKALGYKPESLSDYVKRSGGIVDDDGELAYRGITKKSKRGLVSDGIDKKTGKRTAEAFNQQIDEMKRSAWEAGYFPEYTDYNAIDDGYFLDRLADDVQGNPLFTWDVMQDIDRVDLESGAVLKEYEAAGIQAQMTAREIADMLAQEDASEEAIFRAAQAELSARQATSPEAIKEKHKLYTGAWESELEQAVEAEYTALQKMADDDAMVWIDDGSGEAREVPLREVLDDIETDDAIVKAMTTCGVRG